MKKLLKYFTLFIIPLVFIIGCENTSKNENEKAQNEEHLKTITYDELKEKISNKDTFILEVVQTGCPNCTEFTPVFTKVLEENNIVAYSINLTNFDKDEDFNAFQEEYNVSGTPTVIFFKDGSETSTMRRLVGNQDESIIISKLKSNGYLSD